MTERTILITGCSSGLGYDAAHGLRARGWRVFASCRKAEDCARLMSEGFESPLIDYADSNTIYNGLAEILEKTGGTLDAVYNNGAFACPGAVEDLPRGALRDIFETNLFGVHELTQAVIPVMRQQGHGRIINCSSVLGLCWNRGRSPRKFAKTQFHILSAGLISRTPHALISMKNCADVSTRIRAPIGLNFPHRPPPKN